MLFNSWQFILAFLPVCVLVYFGLNRLRLVTAGKAWLVLASLAFYAYWDPRYLPLILSSILFNYGIGDGLAQAHPERRRATGKPPSRVPRRALLVLGIAVNLGVLGYFKYTDFFLANANAAFGTSFALPGIVLPLAISFFTFTQIVYLVDSYRGETAGYDLLNYALFVTFFPHLIAGPIVQHSQIMPQFASRWTLSPRQSNIAKGLCIFAIGLFKKVVIADQFATWADAGFDGGQRLDFVAAWTTSLSYTFQLYFDFSGYCDMAMGASLLFNIRLPINFDSPYKALDIQDFWRRWHITLSNFLRDYLYIPLGGNRHGEARAYLNLMVTFLLGGLWHGATWMFVIWGGLHGLAVAVHRVWRRFGRPLPTALAWALTFLFVNAAWVFFRARTLEDAMRVLQGMGDIRSLSGVPVVDAPTADLAWAGVGADTLLAVLPSSVIGALPTLLAIALAFVVIAQRNSNAVLDAPLGTGRMAWAAVVFSVAMYAMFAATSTVFLYFNF